MAKKRVIYTLLYSDGSFMLSRNFRLQKAGDVLWLLKNYHFESVSACIDELMIIDVSRGSNDQQLFLSVVSKIVESCFIPVTLGGCIRDFETAASFVKTGADKILVNSIFDHDPNVVKKIAEIYGSQCIVGGIDVRRTANGGFEAVSDQGSKLITKTPSERVAIMLEAGTGEILLQSIDRDGTGFGFDFDTIACIDFPLVVPLILAGGCGKGSHMYDALIRPDVDAISTANLFNFIGNGLSKARTELMDRQLDLATWNSSDVESLRGILTPLH